VRTNARLILHAPLIFKIIRREARIDDRELMSSLDPENNLQQIFKANMSVKHQQGGKSGSFFFFTEDRHYIIKSIGHQEMSKYLAMMPALLSHYRANPGSLIQKILGIYTIKLPGLWKFNVMMQRNVVSMDPAREALLLTFDLKGSSYNRSVMTKMMAPNYNPLDTSFSGGLPPPIRGLHGQAAPQHQGLPQ